MRLRSLWGSLAFLAAFALNPAYFAGCVTGDDPDFKYGAKDLEKFAHAANDSFEFSDASGRYRLDLAVSPTAKKAQAPARRDPFARSAYACGERRLYATASACEDYSSMGISASVTLFRIDAGKEEAVLDDTKAKGIVYVWGLNLSGGEMSLTFDGGSLDLQSVDGKSFTLESFDSDAVSWRKSS